MISAALFGTYTYTNQVPNIQYCFMYQDIIICPPVPHNLEDYYFVAVGPLAVHGPYWYREGLRIDTLWWTGGM